MRVVIAPDSFAGTLSAAAAAAAIAEGWRRAVPADEPRALPLADGGPGFLDVLHGVLGGRVRELTVTGPLDGAPVAAGWLKVGTVAYLEAAQVCGPRHVPEGRLGPAAARVATSRGVGELIAAAAGDPEITRIVVGLGGSACTDGGTGALAALGAGPSGAGGEPLPDGGAASARSAPLAVVPGLRDGVELVLAEAVGRDPGELAEAPGVGPAGGLGAALLALGGTRVSGAALVRELSGLDAALDAADLVVTGEGSFDWRSLRGTLVTVVAEAAAARGLPCLVLAGQVSVGRREAAAVGVQDAYSVADHVGGVAAALADPAGTLAALAEDVAGQWSGSR